MPMPRAIPARRFRDRLRRLAALALLAPLALLALVVPGAAPRPALAQGAGPDALKAEVTYRALMFVTWPAERETGRSLQLCTAADNTLEAAMQSLVDDGTYEQILSEWGVEAGGVDTIEINAGS